MVHINDSHDLINQYSHINLEKVVLESRFSSDSVEGIVKNKKFTLACMRDCFLKGEAPYASHVIYAHPHFLDDFIASERALGMHAGFLWGDLALKTVVYTDLGISSGMQMGIDHAIKMGRNVEYRELGFIPSVSNDEILLEKQITENQKNLLNELKEKLNWNDICLTNVNKKRL